MSITFEVRDHVRSMCICYDQRIAKRYIEIKSIFIKLL